MGQIKSALELALEKTADIKVDKEAVAAHEAKDKGKRLAGRLFSDPEIDSSIELKKYSGKELQWVREGFFSSAMGNFVLPQSEEDLKKLPLLQKAFETVISDKAMIKELFTQLGAFFGRYLEDQKRLVEGLEKQFAPRLKQKEEELARKTGQAVKLQPAMDPEFVKYLQQNMGQLTIQYQAALDDAKAQLESSFGGS